MGKIVFNRPLQIVDQISGESANVKVLKVEACNKFAGYDMKVTCNWLAGSDMADAVLVVYVNSESGACADHEGCPLRGRMINNKPKKGLSRNARRKIARLKAIDAHNTALVLARKRERQEIVTRNMSTPRERTYGLRAAMVYQRGMYKS